jgi:protein SCO1/2
MIRRLTQHLASSPLLARISAAVACVALLSVAGPSRANPPGEPEPDLRPREVRGLEISNKLGDVVPLSLTFTQVDGSTVKLGDFFNLPAPGTGGTIKKPVVLMMVYFRCPILCPMVLEKFTKTLNELDFTAGTEYDALVVSFDPRDKPVDAVKQRAEQLLFYKQPTSQTIRDGWNFLTCHEHPENALALADSLGFPFRFMTNTGEYSHGAAVFVLTPEGKISRYLLGLDYPARDVRFALLEASQGKIGNVFDRFTLWCYHFDPEAGVYTLQAMRVMQVGASLCAVLLGGLIFSLLSWERRKRRRLAAPAASMSADPVAIAAVSASPHPSAPAPALTGRA